MPREIQEPVTDEQGYETHPAFGMIGASRTQVSPPGSSLFDSDLRHQHTVVLRLYSARRQRDLNRDWIGTEARLPIAEVEMSEAQWASFVSSFGVGDGVPCTIRGREGDPITPGIPFEPRMKHSLDEVRNAADDAIREVAEAFEAYDAHRTAANRRTLAAKIRNLPSNITFAAKSLGEHAENVVQKSKADIEAMALRTARSLGLEPGDLGGVAELGAGEEER